MYREVLMCGGRTVLVTGSSRGIGRAIARLAALRGARVILHGKKDSNNLRLVAQDLRAECVVFDVTDEAAVRQGLSKFGAIDVLVNNAGMNPSQTFQNLTNQDWVDTFSTNLFGTVNVSRAVLDGMMKKRSGAIVNIASIKGFTHVSGKPAYAASKAALIQLTARMAEELAPWGIRINAVAPGFAETELTQATLARDSGVLQEQISRIPMKRMAKLEEIAEAALFLASDKASYITGQCLAVDGGLSIV